MKSTRTTCLELQRPQPPHLLLELVLPLQLRLQPMLRRHRLAQHDRLAVVLLPQLLHLPSSAPPPPHPSSSSPHHSSPFAFVHGTEETQREERRSRTSTSRFCALAPRSC